MPSKPRILAFAGSLRTDSYNKRLVKIAMSGAASAGADTTFLDLRDLDLPVFDEDLEKKNGPPPGATKLKQLMMASDGFLIASPEYNSSVTAALKNAIDWASRPAAGEKPLAAFAGKSAVIMAASPGALGGLRGLVHLRAILGNINVIVLPEQRAVSAAHEAFNEDGSLKNADTQSAILGLGTRLAEFLSRMKS